MEDMECRRCGKHLGRMDAFGSVEVLFYCDDCALNATDPLPADSLKFLHNSIDFGDSSPFGITAATHVKVITLHEVRGSSFACHVDNGTIVIDECEGINPAQGLSLFEPWMLGIETEKEP